MDSRERSTLNLEASGDFGGWLPKAYGCVDLHSLEEEYHPGTIFSRQNLRQPVYLEWGGAQLEVDYWAGPPSFDGDIDGPNGSDTSNDPCRWPGRGHGQGPRNRECGDGEGAEHNDFDHDNSGFIVAAGPWVRAEAETLGIPIDGWLQFSLLGHASGPGNLKTRVAWSIEMARPLEKPLLATGFFDITEFDGSEWLFVAEPQIEWWLLEYLAAVLEFRYSDFDAPEEFGVAAGIKIGL